MAAMTAPILSQEEKIKLGMESLAHLAELGMKATTSSVEKMRPVQEAVREEVQPSLASSSPGEVYVIIRPLPEPGVVFRFFKSLQEATGAEIAFFTSSHKGAAIKLALRNHVSIVDILVDMTEVDEATQEEAQGDHSDLNLPSYLTFSREKTVHVTLKAA